MAEQQALAGDLADVTPEQRAALEAAFKVLDDADIFDDYCIADGLDPRTVVAVFNKAARAAGAKYKIASRNDIALIVASAVYAIFYDLDTNEVHPFCVGAEPMILFARWYAGGIKN